jgi:excisionase family DNA binding protein
MQQPLGYTPREVASMLGVKQSTVYAWLSRKELIGHKYGQYRYITQYQLQQFYQKRTTGEYIDQTYLNKPYLT